MSRQQWPNDAEAARQRHLLRQEEDDRAYRRFNSFRENREDESRWRRLASSSEAGWIPSPSADALRRARLPTCVLPRFVTPPPRIERVRQFLQSPREAVQLRAVQQRTTQETRECPICVEDKTIDSFLRLTTNCTHPADACSTCVRSWIAGTLNGMNWSSISCLSSECAEVLQYEDMRRIATPEVFRQYEEYATRDAIGAMPNFRYCLNPNCTSGQEHMPDSDAMFICNACGHTACVQCNRSWHSNTSCAEADLRHRQAEDTLSLTKIRQTSLRCPNSDCNVPIEKNQGCAHMTCQNCRTSFCWGCLAIWRGEGGWDTEHKESCDPNRLAGAQ